MSKITSPYLVYDLDTKEFVFIQRDGYYSNINRMVSIPPDRDIELINDGTYNKIKEILSNQK